MPYKRPPQNTKRFLPPLLPYYSDPKKDGPPNPSADGYNKDYLDIPLPNEREFPAVSPDEGGILRGLSSIVDFVKEHVRLEELILIGLIILLLEGSMEDTLLLIILLYILLF